MTPIKIGFVLLSNSLDPFPSTRIAVLNMLPFLRAAHFDPHIVFDPVKSTNTPNVPGRSDLAQKIAAEGFKIIVFQKVYGPEVAALARDLKSRGIKTVFLVCDLIDPEMAEITDATIAVTEFLKSLYPAALQTKVHVVHDGIEHPEVVKTTWRDDSGSRERPLHAVLVTSSTLDELPLLKTPPDWLRVTIVGRYPPRSEKFKRLHEIHWNLAEKRNSSERFDYIKFLINRHILCEAWDSAGVYEHMQQADIAIIPINTQPEFRPGEGSPPGWIVKSENRLTMKMAIGLPVIATAIPSYEPVIEQGVNGFLAHSQREWLEILDTLRDAALRKTIGEKARAVVLQRYSMEEQARQLIDVLKDICPPVSPN